MLYNCLAVGLGGAIGAILRYLAGFIPLNNLLSLQTAFPANTMLINIAGSMLIGFASSYFDASPENQKFWMPFFKAGVCGGFTTFSTFSLESFQLMQDGSWICASAYIILSVSLCTALCAASYCAGRQLF